MITTLSGADIDAAVDIHKNSFDTGWDKDSLGEYITSKFMWPKLIGPKYIVLGYFEDAALIGFIVLGPVRDGVTDQTDIITLAVAPKQRGKSVGRKLLDAAEERAKARGVEIIFLEVAQDNTAALALYKSAGYDAIGTRKNYYKRAGGRVSAVTFRKQLSPKT